MPEYGDQTALIDAAERAFAARGVHGSSLREITLAAGVRNKSAVQYHFGDRAGLVRAVLARRGETLRLRRALQLEQLVVDGLEHDPRAVCRVIVEPYCAFLADGDGALSYLVVVREVVGDPSVPYESLPDLFGDPLLLPLVERVLHAVDLRPEIAAERALVAVSTVIGAVADRARRELHPDSTRLQSPAALFVANLVDMVLAATTAPAGPNTRDTLGSLAAADPN